MGDLARGAGYLRRGGALLRPRPRLYLLGLVPAALVFVVLAGLYVVLLLHVSAVAAWLTPFADDWADAVRGLVRFCVGLALLVAGVLLWLATFTGLTLTVGDPFYEKIWRETEHALGPVELGDGLGFWRSLRDGLRLTAIGVACSVIVLASGFVPVIGPVFGIVLGLVLTGRLLGRELVVRAFEARGLDGDAQDAILAPHRRTVLGFGVATQLCFLVPLGGVFVMPIAVAGATALARDVLPEQRLSAVKVPRRS